MSDPTNPNAPPPAPAATAQQPASASPSPASPAQTAPPVAAPAAPYVNPYARAVLARAAAPVAAPSTTHAPVAAPVASVAAPPQTPAASDPRVADLASQVEALRGVVRAQADDALASVPDTVRATVHALAGDDPAKRLEVLRTLRTNGLVTAPPTVPQGASTMHAAAPAPPPVASAASSDAAVLAEYERLRSNNSPIVATAFAERNRAALTRARAARN